MSTQPKSTGPKNRCAIYTRKSCEEGLDLEFNSLHAQRESAEAFTGRASLSTILIGLTGNDRLSGGSQRDLLFGGAGADIMQAGSEERFWFRDTLRREPEGGTNAQHGAAT